MPDNNRLVNGERRGQVAVFGLLTKERELKSGHEVSRERWLVLDHTVGCLLVF